jgi:tetratricopeptide (TPR) repeat protein
MRLIRWLALSALAVLVVGFVILFMPSKSGRTPSISDSLTKAFVSLLPKRDQADWLISEAGKKLAEGSDKENVRLLKEAAQLDPSNRRVWWKLCEGYQLTKELDLAVSACKWNIEIDHSGLSYNSLGLVYLAKKDYLQASNAFDAAAKDSQDPGIHKNLVWALVGSRQYQKAISAAQRMVEVSATDPADLGAAYQMLGTIYLKLGQREKAEESFDKLRKVDPKWVYKTCEMTTDNEADLHLTCHN